MPALRAGDDSPLSTTFLRDVRETCHFRWLPTPRSRRSGRNATSPTPSRRSIAQWWSRSPGCCRAAHAAPEDFHQTRDEIYDAVRLKNCCGVWNTSGKEVTGRGRVRRPMTRRCCCSRAHDPHWDSVMISAVARCPSSALNDRPEIPRPSDHRRRCPGRRLFCSRSSEEECGRVLHGCGRP
jgi:hypothetical protein